MMSVPAGFADRFGRRLTYLRISVTDRCNMRCHYCRPSADAYRAESHANILQFEEMERIVRIAAGLGVKKLRLTGGEPLVRRELPLLVARLAAIPGIEELTMTTNATLLAQHAGALAQAGLHRVNVSLDSLNPARFRELTGGELAPVLEGLARAAEAGLHPIKLNTVLLRGINDDEVAAIIDFAVAHRMTARFIELMPMRYGLDWQRHYIAVDELLQHEEVRQRLDPVALSSIGQTAARYVPCREAGHEVGFIMPMSDRFCGGCNRLRLTADGGLRSCLPADDQINLRTLIRQGGSDHDIRQVFLRAARLKPEVGVYEFQLQQRSRSMIHIGG